MKRIVLVDDEPPARALLRALLNRYCPAVECVGEAGSVAAAEELIRRVQPDAVLLDVAMEDGTGFDLLDRFPGLSFQVIFTSAHHDYAVRAFRYHALDYLLKPVAPRDLIAAIGRLGSESQTVYLEKIRALLESTRENQLTRLVLSTLEGQTFLPLEDIIRLESDGNYTTFHVAGHERHVVSRSIKEFEELLPAGRFFRVHQSHIVNLAFVRKIVKKDGDYAVMSDGRTVPIARRRKDEFVGSMVRFSGGATPPQV
jgi:two-component system LytT family response regulator